MPPILVPFATENLEFLVGVVGSYAGVMIQYIIPAMLVYYARIVLLKLLTDDDYFFGLEIEVRKRFKSPFSSKLWIYFVLIWSCICILFVTANHIITWTS